MFETSLTIVSMVLVAIQFVAVVCGLIITKEKAFVLFCLAYLLLTAASLSGWFFSSVYTDAETGMVTRLPFFYVRKVLGLLQQVAFACGFVLLSTRSRKVDSTRQP